MSYPRLDPGLEFFFLSSAGKMVLLDNLKNANKDCRLDKCII